MLVGWARRKAAVNVVWISGADNHPQQRGLSPASVCLLKDAQETDTYNKCVTVCVCVQRLYNCTTKPYSSVAEKRNDINQNAALYSCITNCFLTSFSPWVLICNPMNISVCQMILQHTWEDCRLCFPIKKKASWALLSRKNILSSFKKVLWDSFPHQGCVASTGLHWS